jgi:hypothetical protein
VQFDRILEPFTGPFERVTDWNVKPSPGMVADTPEPAAFTLDLRVNDSWIAVNRLLAAGDTLAALHDPASSHVQVLVDVKPGTAGRVGAIARELGLSFGGVQKRPAMSLALKIPRVGLWDQYGGSMTSGWTRWILERFEFKFDRVFPPQLDAGGLDARFDVLIFPDGGIPGVQAGGRGGRGAGTGADPSTIPAEYRAQVGRVTVERTIPQLRQFVEAGGTIVAIGESAANLAAHFHLPVESHLVENGSALPASKYFVPGSVLSAKVDTSTPAAAGVPSRVDVFFDNSPVFKLKEGVDAAGVKRIAEFDTPTPLRSGWAWGQHFLKDGVIALEVRVGKGRVLLFGPEILHRAQPHGTFKFLFNAIYLSVVH